MLFVAFFAAFAHWTGRAELVEQGTACQYSYEGQTFWQVYAGDCPASVEIK